MSSPGKASPQSTTMMLSSYSKAVMFIPICSRPPNGMIFSLPLPSFLPSRPFCLAGAGSAFDSPEFLAALDSPEFLDAFGLPVPLEVLAPVLSLDLLAAVPVWASPFCPVLLFACPCLEPGFFWASPFPPCSLEAVFFRAGLLFWGFLAGCSCGAAVPAVSRTPASWTLFSCTA